MNAIDRAMDGAAHAGINNAQKRELILIARKAYRRQQEDAQVGAMDFEAWRHNQQLMTIEKESLVDATNEDFRYLKAHFLRLAGADRQADRIMGNVHSEPARVARYKLGQECTAARDVIENAEAYVAAIAKTRFKTSDLGSLTARQVWGLVFDLRRNAQRRRKAAEVGSQRSEVGSQRSDGGLLL